MSVLVVAAHPDDEILGCGATMAKRAASGEAVDVLILGEGSTARAASRETGDQRLVDRLRADCRSAADAVGVRDVVLEGLPDNRFDTVALLDVVKLVEREIEARRPTTVLCQHGGDVNVDHRTVFQAVLAATRPVPGHPVREVLAFEVGSSTEWAFGALAPPFRPMVFEDVTGFLDAKVAALRCYPSELRAFPHPRSPEALRAAAARWGSAVGVAAAEAFAPVRLIR
ncbi:MAG: PIG-L family deacetylase [Acidimicrobiales bacterium]|nr:PIG-L family deacetylase [Acidimicrobiales bacterium]MCB1014244.1 PIG-L family deacetylase [Acidimicrobiales bacterium]MCB9372578.1 PIG-L family deacetylase [Microthrixaceae bacterium]